ncbi:NACHT domain-containing protein [Micromonospora sp. NPDC093244]|uniref:NACHT domain-containing protein n=1 Tax=Micromonospora sp. NPDC093244 TaxID=3155071 RepID=UPI0034172E3C
MPTPIPSPSPATDPVGEFLRSITGLLPEWTQPIWLVMLPIVAWLVLPQQIVGGLRWFVKRARPTTDKEDARRAKRKARFAAAMAARVSDISAKEDWQDDRFAELEAEVEVHGRQGRWPSLRQRETIRRVSSLSVALNSSPDSIILLEGEPGAGKSVAMRHLAIQLATAVKDSTSRPQAIPIYINLKEFRPQGPVDVQAIRAFVKDTVNRANDHLIEKFFDDEFDRGLIDGSWLFLFDSFDEIPDILGATEAGELIDLYATALYDFLSGMGKCRGIIASREFRGPKRIAWPRFKVLQLGDRQQRDLIRKLDLPTAVERQFMSNLFVADPAIKQLAGNPLFLALLCENQRDGDGFPRSSHKVFEAYIAKRLMNDKSRLISRFGITHETVRIMAEKIAFAMAAEPSLGLSPPRREIVEGLYRQGSESSERVVYKALDALEYLRLARAVPGPDGAETGFTFSHRRFQEYFATCLVLREGERVEPLTMLTDGKWRETAVTLMNTQPDGSISKLLQEAEKLLVSMLAQLELSMEERSTLGAAGPFEWPAGSLHLLSLLQAGLSYTGRSVPAEIRRIAGRILDAAYLNGQLHDRRWAIDVCLAADDESTTRLLRKAFASGSSWLREGAFSQAGHLPAIPRDLRMEMRLVLASLAAGGYLRRHRLMVDAQLRRLVDPQPERLLMKLFIAAPLIDFMLLGLILGITIVRGAAESATWGFAFAIMLLTIGCFHLYRDCYRLDWEQRYSVGPLRWFYMTVAEVAGLQRPQTLAKLSKQVRFAFAPSIALMLVGKASLAPLPRSLPESLALSVVAAYVCGWGMLAVRGGGVIENPRIWRIVAMPMLYMARLPRLLSLVRVRMLLIAGSSTAIVGAFGFALYQLSSVVLNALGVVMFGVGVIGTLVVVSRNIFRWWHDKRLLALVRAGSRSYEGFYELLSVLSEFQTDRAVLTFIQIVKRNRMRNDGDGAVRALCLFAELGELRVERSVQFAKFRTRVMPDEVSIAQEFATRWISGRRHVSQAVLDEVGKIVADVAIRRYAAQTVGVRIGRQASESQLPSDGRVER